MLTPVMFGPRTSRYRVFAKQSPEWIVLLNGIGPSTFSVNAIAPALVREGFSVAEIIYPSTRYPLLQLAQEHVAPLLDQHLAGVERLHFVTQSMGGIVTRVLMQQRRPANLGRVVMLCPPNQGSEVSDWLEKFPLYRHGFGPAGQELRTAPEATVNQLGPVDFPCGVIAGRKWYFDPWFAWLFGAPNDGKVAVNRTRVEGMTDFRIVNACHYLMACHREVRQLVPHFLRHGHFPEGVGEASMARPSAEN